jgi:hypothetical protein
MFKSVNLQTVPGPLSEGKTMVKPWQNHDKAMVSQGKTMVNMVKPW